MVSTFYIDRNKIINEIRLYMQDGNATVSPFPDVWYISFVIEEER